MRQVTAKNLQPPVSEGTRWRDELALSRTPITHVKSWLSWCVFLVKRQDMVEG